jgi:5-methylcytosine-specific restriction enzyme subunit McrC
MSFLKTKEDKHFIEHHGWYFDEIISEQVLPTIPDPIYFKKNKGICVEIKKENRKIHTNYYIGIDWVNKEKTIYVEPKLNKDSQQTNYLAMLFSALKHPEIADYTNELYEIKWEQQQIEITQNQDLLTPLLVVQFLKVVQSIVRKGLKKSYYRVERNLYSRVKGKIMIAQTIKQNLLKNKPLNTYCTFDEFGINGLENRLLKKALIFVQRYLPTLKNLNAEEYTANAFNYINPAFESVSEEVSLHDVKHTKTNVFYKEYAEGIRLAKLILKRFGYNINTTQEKIIKTPPFWIDMSKLFELYVLGLLKDRFRNEVEYHYSIYGNELDYLLDSTNEKYSMVIDAKYRTLYSNSFDNEDIRQISGYARLKSVYQKLNKDENEVVDCLIIYPDQEKGFINLKGVELKDKGREIDQFVQFYKLPVKLPVIKGIETNKYHKQ